MNPRFTRLLLALAMALVGALALSAVAEAAAGTIKVYDGGTYKRVEYTGTADVNVVTFGGSFAAHSVTISEVGIADPGAGGDPGNICDLTSPGTLTCTDPKLGLDDRYAGRASMGAGNDVTTSTGTQIWQIEGDQGADSLTGSDQSDDDLNGGPDNDTLDGRGDSGELWATDNLRGDEGNDVLRGGPGDDYLDGGSGNDDLDGGAGGDGLWGHTGVDTLRAGPGDDYLRAGEGDGELSDGGDGSDSISCEGDANEVYDGGPGFDSIGCYGGVETADSWDPDDYLIDLAGGVVRRTNHVQTNSTITSTEDAETGEGEDVLIGTDGANSLWAGAGNDAIDGRGGTDYISGRQGNDTIESGDGAPDRADGGPDADTCHADQVDELSACEALTLAPTPTGGAADQAAPNCKVGRVAGNRAKGVITFRATCNEAATLGAEAIGHLRRLSPGALASRIGDVTLGSRSARVSANGSVRITLRLSKRYRRALPRRGRIRVVLHATDASGNGSAVSRIVRMR